MSTTSIPTALAPAAGGPDADAMRQRGDYFFFAGCFLCGTWILGAIGAPILFYGLWLTRKAQLAGAAVRPWTVTIVGGLIMIDSLVNYIAWGTDFFPAHHSFAVRTLWINYGLFGDGGYALLYNTTGMGGVHVPAEKANQVACVLLAMPMKAVAAFGFLNMKRWGLQFSIVANWCYLSLWMVYAAAMTLQFDLRFGTSDFGVIGFWIIGGIPYLGPVVLLPYLHTVNRELWTE